MKGLTQFQSFPQKGQLPTSAYPLCASDTFRQLILPYGYGGIIKIPGCGQLMIHDPYYYSFTCYTSGTMSLLINPLFSSEDYNWELFDITGRDPNDIYTDESLAVAGNWSGRYGGTGTKKNGSSSMICLSSPNAGDSTFSTMPDLIQGHHYLLLVTCYSQAQSDYDISFAGGTAVISNTAPPHLKSAFVGCNNKFITVVMNKQMRCYSISTDGSSFSINSSNVSITGATGNNCNDQFDFDTLQLSLSDTLSPGNYELTVKTGNDGKIIWDDCLNSIPQDDKINFSVQSSQSISANFNYLINYGCLSDTVFMEYKPLNGADRSIWYIDSVFFSSEYEPSFITSVFSPFHVQHIVSNGFCTDTASEIINLDNRLQAGFQSAGFVCPTDLATFSDTSIGNIISWKWSFGDGTFSSQQTPPAHLFPATPFEKKYLVSLEIKNNKGCFDTVSRSITKLQSCYIAIPNAFTPNGDGINDYLYPINAFSVVDMHFMVFDRFGQAVFETRSPTNKWDGRINGQQAPAGVYIWTFRFTDGISGKKIFMKGTSVLIR
jgi:gliding motility-associated-like protein